MSVAVLSPRPLLQALLKDVFDLLGVDSDFVDALPEDIESYDLIITDSAQLLTQLESQSVFLISNDENIQKNDAQRVFKAPVRVGNLCDEVLYFLKQKKITHDLKPISLGDAVLHPSESVLEQRQGKVKLTDKELSILLRLAEQYPKKIVRNDLLDHVWGYAEGVETHTLETHIYRLRQKIEIDPANPQFLMTDDEGYFLDF